MITDVNHLIDEYRAGTAINELAARHHIHRTAAAAHHDRHHEQTAWDDQTLMEAAELYATGLSLTDVADRCGIDEQTVANSFRELGFRSEPAEAGPLATTPTETTGERSIRAVLCNTVSMGTTRSSFLNGALAWIGNGTIRDRCDICAFEWTIQSASAVDAIEAAPGRYSALLADRDGMVAPDDGGWNATAYLWHLTDLARSWSERWVQIGDDPGSLLAGWDPDVLATARNYRNLPTIPALWALDQATISFAHLSRELDQATPFEHGDWGAGTVADGLLWLAHEYTHHQLDVEARAR